MTRERFEHELTRAKTLQQLGDRPQYWAGYIRGLKEVYHGQRFGTDEEHERWLSLLHDTYESNQDCWEGYREGLKVQGFEQ